MPVLVIGAAEDVAAINPPLEAILGPGLLGRHYVSALRQPSLLDRVESVRRNGQAAVARYLGRDGTRDTTYDVHIRQAGSHTILTFQDRTAAEDVDTFRRDFVANVSHELRTPLTALLGFIETLRGAARDDPAAQHRFLGVMENEAGRMKRLVNDLLSLSQVEEQERQRPSDPVNLAKIVSATVSELEPVIAAKSAQVTLSLDADQTIPGDDNQLRQVIGNLIENAVKYGPEGVKVHVSLSRRDDEPRLRGPAMALTVADDGPGIPAHHIPRLTERFYRVDSHRSRSVGGTGLGLAIVKHIINRHRGRLKIDSTEGGGTSVLVLLPVSTTGREASVI